MKKKITFSDKARAIMRKYPRAKFDAVEKEAMEQELDALIAEQEAMKQAMGVGAPEQQMGLDTQQAMLEGSMEEPQMFKWGGGMEDPYKKMGYKPVMSPFADELAGAILQMQGANKISPNFEVDVYGKDLSNKTNSSSPVIPTPAEVAAMVPTQASKPYSFNMSGLKFNPEVEEDLSGLDLTSKKFYSPTKSGWDKLKENEFLPSYIAAGAGILGNVGQMLMDKKPKDINFARYSPEEVDLSAQRLAAEREADLGRAVGRTTARNLGMGAGQAMSSIVSSESGVSRNLSDALMKSRLAEEGTNVDARNRAGQFNAELGMREKLMNTQQQEAWKERQREYLAGATNVIPETMQDINKIKAQREYLKKMGMSEEKALEWLSKKYPNYSIEQLKNGLASGTLFKNIS